MKASLLCGIFSAILVGALGYETTKQPEYYKPWGQAYKTPFTYTVITKAGQPKPELPKPSLDWGYVTRPPVTTTVSEAKKPVETTKPVEFKPWGEVTKPPVETKPWTEVTKPVVEYKPFYVQFKPTEPKPLYEKPYEQPKPFGEQPKPHYETSKPFELKPFPEQPKPYVEPSKPFEQSKPFSEQPKPFVEPTKPFEQPKPFNEQYVEPSKPFEQPKPFTIHYEEPSKPFEQPKPFGEQPKPYVEPNKPFEQTKPYTEEPKPYVEPSKPFEQPKPFSEQPKPFVVPTKPFEQPKPFTEQYVEPSKPFGQPKPFTEHYVEPSKPFEQQKPFGGQPKPYVEPTKPFEQPKPFNEQYVEPSKPFEQPKPFTIHYEEPSKPFEQPKPFGEQPKPYVEPNKPFEQTKPYTEEPKPYVEPSKPFEQPKPFSEQPKPFVVPTKPFEQPKPFTEQYVEPSKPFGQPKPFTEHYVEPSKPFEQQKPFGGQPKPYVEPSKPFEQPKPYTEESKPYVDPSKPFEQTKPYTEETKPYVEPIKPFEQPKPYSEDPKPYVDPSKPFEQPKPYEEVSKPFEPIKPFEKEKPVEQTKPEEYTTIVEPKPFEYYKPTEQFKPHDEVSKPFETTIKPLEQEKPFEQPKPFEQYKPTVESKPSEQFYKPTEQPQKPYGEQYKPTTQFKPYGEQYKPTEQSKPTTVSVYSRFSEPQTFVYKKPEPFTQTSFYVPPTTTPLPYKPYPTPCNYQITNEIVAAYHYSVHNMTAPIYQRAAALTEGHFVFSPYTIWLSMAAIAEGSWGETQEQLFKILGLPYDNCRRQAYYHIAAGGEHNTGNDIVLARNRLFVADSSIHVNKQWEEFVESHTHLKTVSVPYKKNPVEEIEALKKVFKAHLPNINLSGNSLILESLDYHGLWSSAFTDAVVQEGPFYNSFGKQIGVVEYMKTVKPAKIGVVSSLNMKVIVLPVGKDGRYGMYFTIPLTNTEHYVRTFEPIATSLIIEATAHLKYSLEPVEIVIPKMAMTSELDVRHLFEDVGIKSLWTDPLATRNISDPAAMPSAYTQRVTVTIDDGGLRPAIQEYFNYVPPLNHAAAHFKPGHSTQNLPYPWASNYEQVESHFIANKPFMFGLFDSKTHTGCFTASFSKVQN